MPAPATTSISNVWPSRPPGRSGVKRPWSEPKSGHDAGAVSRSIIRSTSATGTGS